MMATGITMVTAGCETRNESPSAPEESPEKVDMPTNREDVGVTLLEQFKKAESITDLDDPEVSPAVALTNSGWYEWTSKDAGWQSIPLGTKNSPIPFGHFERLVTQKHNNVHIASPGQIQEKINAATHASTGGGTVKLKPEIEYTPSSTVTVSKGVTLDFNGAKLAPVRDVDVFHIHPSAQILDPIIDLAGSTFTSSVFVFDPSFDGNYFGDGTTVKGGKTMANQGTGTLFDFTIDGDGHIALVEIDHALQRPSNANTVNTAINLRNNGTEASFINGNVFRGFYRAPNNGIMQRGQGTINGNIYSLSLQPRKSSSGTGWFLNTGRGNVFKGNIWDAHNWGGYAWHLTSEAGDNNVLISNNETLSHYVNDRSNHPNNNIRILSSIQSDSDGIGIGRNASPSATDGVAIGKNSHVPQGTPRGGHLNVNGLAFGAVQGTWSPEDLSKSEVTFSIDEENDELNVVVKYSDGSTVKSGSLDLK